MALAAADPTYVPRFGTTERVLHWAHAIGFTGMTSSGLVLFLPGLSTQIGSRPTVKAVHLGIAAVWMTVVLVIAFGGDRRALRATRRDFEAFDEQDARWLRRKPAASGRFNAGQKSHAIAQAALALLFVVSGALLWLGERNNAFQFPGAIPLHDAATLIGILLVAGHLFLSLVWPATRPALRGMVRGNVRADWARRHHSAWVPETAAPPRSRLGRGRAALVAALTLAGAAGTFYLVDGSLSDGAPVSIAAPRAAAPARQAPLVEAAPEADDASVLAQQAQALEQAGRIPEALAEYERAVDTAASRADLRTAYGAALARSGDASAARSELREAIKLDASYAQAQFYLGAVLVEDGKRAEGRKALRRYLQLDPDGPGAETAQQLLARP